MFRIYDKALLIYATFRLLIVFYVRPRGRGGAAYRLRFERFTVNEDRGRTVRRLFVFRLLRWEFHLQWLNSSLGWVPVEGVSDDQFAEHIFAKDWEPEPGWEEGWDAMAAERQNRV